jgi:plasmid stabilization system protein ParE
MGWQVIYAPLASGDLEQIVSYIAQDDPQAALKVGYRLADQAQSLSRQPFRGSLLRHRSDVRKLVCRPYLVVYRVKESIETVEILRFWHGARDQRRMEIP